VTLDHPLEVDYRYSMSVLEPDGSRTTQDDFRTFTVCNINRFPNDLATVGTVCPGQCEVTDVDPDKNNRCPPDKNCPSVGNPINPLTGNKNQQEIDYNGPGAFALRFDRYYSSSMAGGAVVANANLSVTWNHSYARSISNRSALPDAATMRRGDGRLLYFQFAGGLWRPDADVPVKLERLVDGGGATTGWRYTSESDEVEIYDAAGRLVSIANREGLTQTLTYDAQGRLFQVTDAWGKQLTFAYDASNRISTLTDPAGGIYTYAYDASARLASVTYPGGAVRTYLYELGGTELLTGILDENGQRFATYGYSAGKAISSEHAGGAGRVTLSTNLAGAAAVTDVLGSTRAYSRSVTLGMAKNTGITGPACPECGPAAQTFDENGNLASRTDWNGNRSTYIYDLTPNLETSRTEGLDANGAPTPQTRTITTEWHPVFRLIKRRAEPLRITTYVYNGDGGASCGLNTDGVTLVPGMLCSKSIQATTDASGAAGLGATPSGAPRTWTYTYNANGLVLTMDGPRTEVADAIAYTYYADNDSDLGKRGNVAAITNAAGHVTSITAYNAHGQPLTIVNPNGQTTTLAYDARQRLTSRTTGGETTAYEYDPVGQRTKVTLPDNSFLSYSYDLAHRLTGMQDNLGNRIAYTLDLAGNRTQEQVYDPANALAQTHSRVYSNLNRLSQEIGASGQTTEYAYDNQGNVLQVKDPLTRITTNAYDLLNRLTTVQTFPSGTGPRKVTYHSTTSDTVNSPNDLSSPSLSCPSVGALFASAWNDTFSFSQNFYKFKYVEGSCSGPTYPCTVGSTLSLRLTCTQNCSSTYNLSVAVGSVAGSCEDVPAGSTLTHYAYNGLDALTQVTDPRDLVTAYTVDGLGNLSQQVSPDTGTTTNTYDAAGNLLTQTDAKGQTTMYTYDALNRVTQILFHDGSKQTYAYDQGPNGLGRLSSITERNAANQITSVIVYAYEQHGRVTSETRTVNGVQYVLRYSYDAAGRLSGLTYPSGRTVTYSFDTLGRVNQITTAQGSQNQIVVQNVTYHPFGGVKGFTKGNGQTYARSYDQDGRIASYTLGASQFAIGYDDASRIAFISDLGAPANSNTYGYDSLDRLTSAILPSTPFAYSYDAVGNRLSKTAGSGTESYAYDTASNRLSTLTPSSGSARTFGFDQNGSTINDGLNSYIYDMRGRMKQATSAVGTTDYQVNALGQRIRKTNSTDDHVFHYDTGGKLIAESDPGGGAYKR
jgi:YD repeat-containing protein